MDAANVQRESPAVRADGHARLLRYAHIFSSLVRDVLEAGYLREASPHPLSVSQLHLLKLISLNGHHQVGEVAGFLGVSQPAATKNLDKLVRLGLINREPSLGDRRATLVSCSAAGRALVDDYEELKSRRLAPVLDTFAAEERQQLANLLERFSLALIHQEERDEQSLCLRCSAYYEESCPVRHLRNGCPYQMLRQSREHCASVEARA